MRLKDQVAIVTGGSRGIGRGIVKAFAAEGAKVAVIFKGNQAAADGLVAEVVAAGGIAKAHQCDVANHEDASKVVDTVEADWGPINLMVNNAGVIRDGLFVGMRPDEWNVVIQTNLGGTFNFCHAVAMKLARQRKGRIINISSVAADRSNPGQTNYAASKGAINSFTRALAVELAGRGVTVNAIAPGFIETDMSESVPQQGWGSDQEDDPAETPGPSGRHRQGGGISRQRRCSVYHGPNNHGRWRSEPGGRVGLAKWAKNTHDGLFRRHTLT